MLSNATKQATTGNQKVFYINIEVLDASEAIHAKVMEKMMGTVSPKEVQVEPEQQQKDQSNDVVVSGAEEHDDSFVDKEEDGGMMRSNNNSVFNKIGSVKDKAKGEVLENREKVKEKVLSAKEKVVEKKEQAKGKAAETIATVASKVVQPSKVADMMSMKMMKLLPYMMKKQGISLVAERVFIEERYFVLQLQIQHVDVKKLAQGQMQKSDDSGDSEPDIEAIEKEIEEEEEKAAAESLKHASKGVDNIKEPSVVAASEVEKGASLVDWLLGLFNKVTSSVETVVLPSVIQKKMTGVMGEMLSKKFEGKKIQAKAEVLSEENEARYFFASLKALRTNT